MLNNYRRNYWLDRVELEEHIKNHTSLNWNDALLRWEKVEHARGITIETTSDHTIGMKDDRSMLQKSAFRPKPVVKINREEVTIRDEAHNIWIREGKPEGKATEHWFQARKNLGIDKETSKARRKIGILRHSKSFLPLSSNRDKTYCAKNYGRQN